MKKKRAIALGFCVFLLCFIGNAVLQDFSIWTRAGLIGGSCGLVAWLFTRH